MKNNLAKVYHADLYGLREDKYEFLKENSYDEHANSISFLIQQGVSINIFVKKKGN